MSLEFKLHKILASFQTGNHYTNIPIGTTLDILHVIYKNKRRNIALFFNNNIKNNKNPPKGLPLDDIYLNSLKMDTFSNTNILTIKNSYSATYMWMIQQFCSMRINNFVV